MGATMKLPKQCFLALAAIGWADGSMQRIESSGLLRAARESGLADGDLAEVERAVQRRTKLDDVDLGGLAPWDQVFTYALAYWFAQLDGVVSTDEAGPLGVLGDRLGLSPAWRARASAAANDIACLPGGGRPDKFDFDKLGVRIKEKLPQLK
jgi:hypothetical protein